MSTPTTPPGTAAMAALQTVLAPLEAVGQYIEMAEAARAQQDAALTDSAAQITDMSSKIDTLNGQVGTLTTERDTLKAERDTLKTRVTTLTKKAADLQAALDACKAGTTDDPPAQRVLWGTTGEPSAVEAKAGRKVPVHRIYQTGNSVAALESQVRADVAKGHPVVIASLKPGMDWTAVGQPWVDSLAAAAKRCKADGLTVRWAVNHEPEGGGADGTSDQPSGPAGFQALTKRLVAAFAAAGCPEVFGVILMAWTWDTGSHKNPTDWLVPGLGYLGIDYYVRPGNTDVWNTQQWQAVLTTAKAMHLPILLAEFGIMLGDAATDAQRQDAARRLTSWAQKVEADGTVKMVTYFHTTLNGGEPLAGALLDAYAGLVATSPQ